MREESDVEVSSSNHSSLARIEKSAPAGADLKSWRY